MHVDGHAYAKTTAQIGYWDNNEPFRCNLVCTKIGMEHPSIITFLRCISWDDYDSFTLSGAFNVHAVHVRPISVEQSSSKCSAFVLLLQKYVLEGSAWTWSRVPVKREHTETCVDHYQVMTIQT